jgi:hypothetical protein
MRGNLRTHHTRTEYGDFTDHKIFIHRVSPETKKGKTLRPPLVLITA